RPPLRREALSCDLREADPLRGRARHGLHSLLRDRREPGARARSRRLRPPRDSLSPRPAPARVLSGPEPRNPGPFPSLVARTPRGVYLPLRGFPMNLLDARRVSPLASRALLLGLSIVAAACSTTSREYFAREEAKGRRLLGRERWEDALRVTQE